MKHIVLFILCLLLYSPCIAQNWDSFAKKHTESKTVVKSKTPTKKAVASPSKSKTAQNTKNTSKTKTAPKAKTVAKTDTAPKVSESTTTVASTTDNADLGPVYDSVEQMPSFPGGSKALLEYLAQNIIYPQFAEENGIQGRVLVSFVVEINGTVSNVEIVKSVDPSLDTEAIRLVISMPRWTPGVQDGEYVRCKYVLPILFRLS